MMGPVRKTQKKYCSIVLFAAIMFAACFIFAGYKPAGKGLIMGTLASILNFVLMGETIPLRLGHTRGKTFIISLGSVYFRYIIMGIPIFFAIKMAEINLIATVIGIFSVQILILSEHMAKIILSTRKKTGFIKK